MLSKINSFEVENTCRDVPTGKLVYVCKNREHGRVWKDDPPALNGEEMGVFIKSHTSMLGRFNV